MALMLFPSLALGHPSFDEYVTAFQKTYANPSLREHRRATYTQNLEEINECNRRADGGFQTYRCGVNALTDLNATEYRALLGFRPSTAGQKKQADVFSAAESPPPPASVDWRTKGAVTKVKDQQACGACWAFSATGALEGAYAIATKSLRTLSEQQLMDCSYPEGNQGCNGGAMDQAFEYILANDGGLDGEKEYPYSMQDEPCWSAAEARHVATMSAYQDVAKDEASLIAAAALTPVSVAIDATGIQHYKSGVFDGPCGVKLDHGVLVVGYTADAFIVKNSWGEGFGEKGYVRMKRGVAPSGLCGIQLMASFPIVNASSAPPIPPPTPGPRPGLPCNCSASCEHTCGQFGMMCCDGTGGNCACSNKGSCPQCTIHKPNGPYARCRDNSACAPGSAGCVTVTGIKGQVCMPACKGGYGTTQCPAPSDKEQAPHARPYCDACITGGGRASSIPPGLFGGAAAEAEEPNACILVCNATAEVGAAPLRAECPVGATCKPLSADTDPCDNGQKWPKGAHPCQATGNCGLCTYP